MYNSNGLFAQWYKEGLDTLLYILTLSISMVIIYILKEVSLNSVETRLNPAGMDVQELFHYVEY